MARVAGGGDAMTDETGRASGAGALDAPAATGTARTGAGRADGDLAPGIDPTSPIPGVRWGRAVRHADVRGGLAEIWRASGLTDLGPERAGLPDARMVQANLSVSAAGVLRGLHLHRHQLDRWFIAAGRGFVALVDVRPVLVSPAATPIVELRDAPADTWVEIPAGVAHGFLAVEPLTLVYLVTNEYDGSDEHGFAWDDPDAAVAWPPVAGTPDGLPVLSDRDRANPSLRDLAARLRAG
jgi:dTDP-4-dehydrorhamnose 3,5-epimerase